jgi:hypothetical protein
MRVALFLSVAVAGCSAGWQKFSPGDPPAPAKVDTREVIQFQADSHVIRLHAVRFTRDSVSGIPWLEHVSCDSCRVSYALVGVTEMQAGNPGRTAWPVVVPIFILAGLATLLAIGLHGFYE